MKRVMHVVEPFATGVLSFLVDLTRHQVEQYEIFILYGLRPQTPKNVEELFDPRIHLIEMSSFHGAMGTVVNPMAYWDVWKKYRELRPDIVHLHSSATGFVGRWVLPCRTIRVFYNPHGFSFLAGNGPILKRQLFKSMEWLSALRPARTIACSKGEYEVARTLSGNPTYVNNGINTMELTPYVSPYTESKGVVRVCTSGRILLQKNPELFNRIAQLLPKAQFTWIGEGDLSTLLTSKNIKVTGWVSRKEALELLRDSDFFILPSLWEGLPISLLEAMYLKKVCIVSNVTGNKDVIRSGENGFICNEAEEYVEKIQAVVSGKIDGKALTEMASMDIKQNYTTELMAEKYKEIYEEL